MNAKLLFQDSNNIIFLGKIFLISPSQSCSLLCILQIFSHCNLWSYCVYQHSSFRFHSHIYIDYYLKWSISFNDCIIVCIIIHDIAYVRKRIHVCIYYDKLLFFFLIYFTPLKRYNYIYTKKNELFRAFPSRQKDSLVPNPRSLKNDVCYLCAQTKPSKQNIL